MERTDAGENEMHKTVTKIFTKGTQKYLGKFRLFLKEVVLSREG
jgi:hypothetical protein